MIVGVIPSSINSGKSMPTRNISSALHRVCMMSAKSMPQCVTGWSGHCVMRGASLLFTRPFFTHSVTSGCSTYSCATGIPHCRVRYSKVSFSSATTSSHVRCARKFNQPFAVYSTEQDPYTLPALKTLKCNLIAVWKSLPIRAPAPVNPCVSKTAVTLEHAVSFVIHGRILFGRTKRRHYTAEKATRETQDFSQAAAAHLLLSSHSNTYILYPPTIIFSNVYVNHMPNNAPQNGAIQG